ncbi:MAG TPA: M20/M25/M40 family metallo-hydrolase [Gemmatimonadaceae bacterium]|nr:M20/M25/M40 family metallo-hydrolase [Gemmatimonadaceae bacterium]
MNQPLVFTLAGCFALTLTGVDANAQSVALPNKNPRVRAMFDTLRASNQWTIGEQISICEIPAPPFKEQARAGELRRRFAALGLRNARLDKEGNAIAERPGAGGGPTVVISGHLDTVFPETTDVRVKREGTRLRSPGIGDDCRGLAVLLAVARALDAARVRTRGTLIFVGTVGEEGPGNLRGVRHLVDSSLARRIDYFISVDGGGSTITSRAVGSHRYRITYSGSGGHSFDDFGRPSATHALGRAIAAVGTLTVPASPKTTFNVGAITGGTSINAIAERATMEVDLRSESPSALDSLDAAFRQAIAKALSDENSRASGAMQPLQMKIDTIGIRPAAAQPDSARIVRVAIQTARLLGFDGHTEAASTDANYPMNRGIPAITIEGGGESANAHSLDEWYDDGPEGWRGPQWAALVALTLAGVR